MKRLISISVVFSLCCLCLSAQTTAHQSKISSEDFYYHSPSGNRGLDSHDRSSLPSGFHQLSYPEKWKEVSKAADRSFLKQWRIEKGCFWLGLGVIYGFDAEAAGGTVNYIHSVADDWRVEGSINFSMPKYDLTKNDFSIDLQYLLTLNNKTYLYPYVGITGCIYSKYRNPECKNSTETMFTGGANLGLGMQFCIKSDIAFYIKGNYQSMVDYSGFVISAGVLMSPWRKKDFSRYNRIFVNEYWSDPL